MGDGEHVRVKPESFWLVLMRRRERRTPVAIIADNGSVKGGKVNPQLVGSTRLRRRPQESKRPINMEDLEAGFGGFTSAADLFTHALAGP